MRYGNHVTYEIRQVCYQADGLLDAIVFLGKYRENRASSPMRLIQFWWHGKHSQRLTNVLDSHLLPLAEVVRVYARRWDIELAFRGRKDHLHLHHLWSAKPAVIRVQRWCCLILAQVYHVLQVEIARATGVDVFEVSLDLLIRQTPAWLSRGLSPWQQAVCLGRDLGLIRPCTRHRRQVPQDSPQLGTRHSARPQRPSGCPPSPA